MSFPFFKFQKLLRTLCISLIGMFLSFILWKTGFNTQPLRDFKTPQQFSSDLPGCLAIINGDVEGKQSELEVLLASRKRRTILSEDFYLNVTKDCSAYIEMRGFITEPLSEEEKDFPIAYSMVIHEKIEMFERLLRAIYAPQNIYCVHVDQKSSQEFQKAVESIVSCFPNVFVATKLESVIYASWSRVQADLNCMKDLLNSHIQWRYLLNTCGTDFPIKTNAEMVKTLKILNGRNSMESETTNAYKKGRWQYHYNVTNTVIRTNVQKSPPPISSPMFSGNAYFVVTRAFVKYVIEDREAQKLLEWEKDTYSPDEHLWATLQRMPSVPGSMPANSKYDVSDMQAFARVVKWSYLAGDEKNGAPYSRCTGAYRRAVCVYGAGDLLWLLKQHHLLANKFDPEVDDIAIRCMEAVLHFKALGLDQLLQDEYSTTL
ncbi:beta-1,3-galactosyl-O-glycosyl-glycoprotein beta-1,6-N-acetylglucosaminyltransferase 3-like [Anabas testudineus]|uniref:Beta-1,3-galactosyl-O-glycosyl-glycoprotein beta-1,6-N-acetylglucosaminyltransferase 3 n=1 Tax=Anabas testudineus TaxID=64144 RepID=A0AAQ6IJ58_ANATE|nr:beta-1,3-galactosyl-O-glycosyl-glycoprotein beta-1,6-N-acetylglucosaminyltransferase 3-like [Anabas testudineus]XP_026221624.1 beta-1,3-galactosyl-O-glycosyl-glycoprotein beta-1,6-N-acetylglucosaminyltransferase 3-like [Anabas testudineus]